MIEAKINRKGNTEEAMAIFEVWPSQIYAFKTRQERGAADKSKEFVWLVGSGRDIQRKGEIITRLSSRGETEARIVSVLSHPRILLYHSLEYSLYCPQMRYIENITCFPTCCPPKNLYNVPTIISRNKSSS